MSRIYPLADRIIPGGIHAWLLARRAEGLSAESIARQLHTEHDIVVSGQTVRTWLRDLTADGAA